MKMTDNADLNKDIESHFTLKDPRFHTTPTLLDFAIVYEAFYKHHKVNTNKQLLQALKITNTALPASLLVPLPLNSLWEPA